MANTTGTSGDDHLNGGSGDDVLNAGAGADKIGGGSGDDLLDGGSGSDTVAGDSGDDTLVYVVRENVGATDVYDGGSGIDTVRIVMTRDEWMSSAFQADLANYLSFLAANINANNQQASNSEFRFTAFDLRVSKIEKIELLVDGKLIDPTDQAVTLRADAFSTSEDSASIAFDVLANDSVPDLVRTITFTNGGHGTVQWASGQPALTDPASPAQAKLIYTPNPTFYQYLALGETATDSFTYKVTDADGDVSTATVTVTITGANDAPVLAADTTPLHALTEIAGVTGGAGVDTSSATLGFTDVDLTNTHVVTTALASSAWSGGATLPADLNAALAGALTMTKVDSTGTGTGSVKAAFSLADKLVDFLAAGETLTLTYNVTVTDNDGGAATRPVTFVITGTNDAPVITSNAAAAAGAVVEAGNLDNGTAVAGTPTATGTLTSADVDHGATATWSGNAAGTYGAFTIDAATGKWTYTLANGTGSAADQLAEGESRTETFLTAVTDDKGATATKLVTITIAGTNDSPVITSTAAAATGSVAEAGNADDGTILAGTPSATGILTSSDVDHGATAAWSGSAAGAYGAFAIDAVTGKWTYTLDNAKGGAADQLAEGETRTETFLATVTDDKGAIATQTVTVTIAGTNDSPVITSTAAAAAGSVIEAGNLDGGTIVAGTPSATGTLASSDVDHGATATWSGNAAGTFGAFAIDAATGKWTYILANGTGGAADLLAEGESRTETFLATVTDDKGAIATQTVTISITGTNDSPAVTSSAAAASGAVVESGNLDNGSAVAGTASTTGTLTWSDVDHGATATWSGNAAGTYGAFAIDAATGKWTYTLANGTGGAADRLAEGESRTETFLATVTDDKGATATQLVTVTIAGTNDSPVVTSTAAAATGATTEAGNLDDGTNAAGTATATGQLASSDVDNGATAAWSGNAAGTYGSFAIDAATGKWTYTLDNARGGAADRLAEGELRTETFLATVTDDKGAIATQIVTVTVTGTNDSPVISSTAAEAAGAVAEAGIAGNGNAAAGVAATGGTLSASDLDHGATASWSGSAAGTYGAFAIDAVTGHWTYVIDNSAGSAADRLAAGEIHVETFVATVTDDKGATATQAVTVTVTGTNDAPVILAGATNASGAVTEIADFGPGENVTQLSAAGTIAFADVDTLDTHNASAVAQGAGYLGSFTLGAVDQAGDRIGWSFSVADKALDYLAAGQTLVQKYDVTVSDGHGGNAVQTVTVTLTGTNDAPVILTEVPDLSQSANLLLGASAGVTVTGIFAPGGSVNLLDGQPALTTTSAYHFQTTQQTIPVPYTTGYNYMGGAQWFASHGIDAASLAGGIVMFSDGTIGRINIAANGSPGGESAYIYYQAYEPGHAFLSETAGVSGGAGSLTSAVAIAFADVDLTDHHLVSASPPSFSWSAGLVPPGIAASLSLALADSNGTGSGKVTANFSAPDRAFDFLAAGETLTISYIVNLDDGHGGSAATSIAFTIAGTNDRPIIISSAENAAGAVIEAGNFGYGAIFAGSPVATGQLASRDLDHGATATWSGNASGTYGAFAVDPATGRWTYALNNASGSAADRLAEGETRIETFLATVTDDKGATASQLVTVTVTGSNDAPVITSTALAALGSVTEAGSLDNGSALPGNPVATGQLTAFDIDNGATQTWGGNATGAYGSFSIDAVTGQWTYALNNGFYGAADQLAEGESRTETFAANVTDDKGAVAIQLVTVTVTGTNDAPVITSSFSDANGWVAESGNWDDGSVIGGITVATGQLSAIDPDHGATATWSGNASGAYGAFAVDAVTGKWTYTLNDSAGSAADRLAEGETRIETFLATVTDDKGAIATQTITVTVAGLNDAPVITSSALAALGSVTEAGSLDDGAALPGSPVATGQLTAFDIDNGATQIWGGNAMGAYGSFSVDAFTGQWTYALDNSAGSAADRLAEGETRIETFLVSVTDDMGATASRMVTINITGTNDAPLITSSYEASLGAVTEAGNLDDGSVVAGSAIATGQLSASDLDHGATATWSGNASGSFGAFAIDPATGKWTYALNNSAGSAADRLAEGETRIETFLATVTDDKGAIATQLISVTVTGTNDAPVITSTALAAQGLVTEAGSLDDGSPAAGSPVAIGQLTAFDVDNFAALNWSGNASGAYGSFAIDPITGQWTYTLDNSAGGAADKLAEGESRIETFLVTVTDDKGAFATQLVTINVAGTNDAPVITSTASAAAGAVTEAGNLDNGAIAAGTPSATGQLASSDIDHGATATWSGNASGSFGAFAIDPATGQWTYALNNGAGSAADQLAEGETKTDSFLATVTDDKGATATQLVTVTITGTNDSPHVTSAASAASGNVVEAGNLDDGTIVAGTPSATGLLISADPDHGATAAWSGNANGTYGSFTINATTGQWTYALDNSRAATQALNEGQSATETFTATVTDDKGATATQQVLVTVAGTNDAPIAVADNVGGTGLTTAVTGEFLVNTQTFSTQNQSAVTHLAGGGFVVAWSDLSQIGVDSSAYGVKAQIYDAGGVRVGSEFLVNTLIANAQYQPALAALPGGGFVATWTDGSQTGNDTSNYGIKGQLFDATGTKVGGEFSVNSTTLNAQMEPSVAVLASGGLVVTWSDYSNGGVSDIRGQVLSATGARLGEFLVNTTTSGTQFQSVVTVLASGNFVVTWTDGSAIGPDVSSSGVKAQIFSSTGVKIGAEFLVNSQTNSTQQEPVITALSTGGFVVAWSDLSGLGGDASSWGVKAQIYDAIGGKVGSEVLVNTQTANIQGTPAIAAIAGGGFVISWQDLSFIGGDTFSYGIKAQVFDGAGAKLGSEFLVNSVVAGGQTDVSVAALGNGNLVFTWTDQSSVGTDTSVTGVKARIFSAADGISENAATIIDVLANDTDVDSGHAFSLLTASAPAGKGSVAIVNGKILFTPGTDFDHLALGTTETVVLSYTMSDEKGATSSSTVNLRITGANDAPVAVADTAAGTENQILTINVLANDTDVDDNSVLTLVSGTAPAGKGSVSVSGNQLVFNPGTAFDHLAAGQTETVTLGYAMHDQNGGTSSSTVTVTVTGTNDGPTIAAPVATFDGSGRIDLTSAGSPAFTGAGAFSYEVSFKTSTSGPNIYQSLISVGAYTTGKNAEIVIGPDGRLGYSINNVPASLMSGPVVADGQWHTATVTYDGNGNHRLYLDGVLVGTAFASGVSLTGGAVAIGAATTAFFNRFTGEMREAHIWNRALTNSEALDTTSPAPTDSGLIGSYRFANGTAVNTAGSLPNGVLTGVTFGSDALATLVEIADGSTGEGSATLSDSGSIRFADVDLLDVHSAVAAAQGANYLGTFSLSAVDQAQNSVGWSFSVADAALDSLAAGQVLTQVYAVTVGDGQGGSAVQNVTVTLTGTNDAPVVSAAVTGTAVEDGAVATLAALANATDVDNGAVLSIVNVGALPAGVTYNAATKSFALDPSNAAFQSLAQGQHAIVTVTYSISDGIAPPVATSLSWTVTGTNDAPIVVQSLPDLASPEDTAWSYTVPAGSFGDVDNASLSYSATLVGGGALPSWLGFNAATKTFSGTPPLNFNGTIALQVTASDGIASATDSFNLVVTPVNDAPVASANMEAGSFVGGTANYAVKSGLATFPTSNLTVDFFAQIDASNADSNTLVSYATTTGNDNTFLVLAQQNNLIVYINGFATIFSAPAMFDHQWHHVAVTYDGATGHSDLFVDGVLAGSSNHSPAALAAGGTFMLGQEQDSIGGSLDPNQSQIGGIANVNIWSRVLNGTEVANASHGIVALNDPNLVAAYHYNPTTHAYDDASGHGVGMTTVGDLAARAGPDVVRSAIEQTSLDLKASGLAVSDVDAGATPVTVTLSVSEGVLTVAAGTSGVTVANSGTPFVSLTGTVAQINALLTTDASSIVSYFDPSNTPSPSATLTLSVNDNGATGAGGALSTVDTAIITITAVNDAPVVAAAIAGQSTPEDNAWSFTMPAGTFTDVDSASLSYGAALAGGGALPSWLSFNAATHSFSGTPPLNFNGTIALQVTASDGSASATDSFNLVVTPVDDAPVLSLSKTQTSYVENNPGLIVDSSLSLTDPDGPSLNGAVVSITGNYIAGQDVLSFTSLYGITGAFNATTGQLTLSGTATAAQYQEVLRSVAYANGSDNPGTADRTVTFAVTPNGAASQYFAANGHFYEYVQTGLIPWSVAKAGAESHQLFGMQGYLATVTSAAENAFVISKLAGNAWLGGSDAAVEGQWSWVTGPEAGQVFYNGIYPTGTTAPGGFSFWQNGEPNNAGDEDYLQYFLNGWNDLPNGGVPGYIDGYLVEYGGMPGDPALSLSQSITVHVTAVNDAPVLAAAIPDQSISMLHAFTYSVPGGAFTDVDSSLTYSATLADGSALPSWLHFNAATHSFSGTPQSSDLGTVAVKVVASDGLASASDTFNLAVVATIGTNANQTLTGSSGDDTIVGGYGIDTLNGGAGADYIYGDFLTEVAAADLVHDHTLVRNLGGPLGLGENSLAANDDGFVSINLASVFGAGVAFLGGNYSSLVLDNNGFVEFGTSSGPSSFIAGGFAALGLPVIAPFYADIDTRATGTTSYDLDPVNGIFTVTWQLVGPFDQGTATDSVQMQMISTGGTGFDLVFRYDTINWVTASSATAQAGYSNGSTQNVTVPGSGNAAAMMALPTTIGNTGIAGVWVYHFATTTSASGDFINGGPGADVLTGGPGSDRFDFNVGEANGDTILDFNGNGPAGGDSLRFTGYGVGATFSQIDSTHWQINYNSGASHEIITFANAPTIDPTDWIFV